MTKCIKLVDCLTCHECFHENECCPNCGWAPQLSIPDFTPGSVVKHKLGQSTYTIMANYGSRATGVKTIDITNPNEWIIVKKA